ncbi:bergaptol O-methyltransferase [Selaginella moellendorffii]|uniref:bergaptol O-methyltransferase n=1 Tax=Selaginella moellendorffii TaxID=88036 RepID=UPI000D1CE263|nr:bergaptol O-methyltransferase [Selaginella moellendorffii]|eukprot:XP_024542086.1 bergaptol O-methyltransferase [Selaginella moellendorffii]
MASISNAITTPFLLKAVICLGIPDILGRESPLHYNQIAAKINPSDPNPDVVRRILQSLVRNKIFCEDPSGFFSHNNLSSTLVSSKNIHAMVMLQTSQPMVASYSEIHKLALGGSHESAFEVANEGKSLYQYASHNLGFSKMFRAAISETSERFMGAAIKEARKAFEGIKGVIVDVGGGHGACVHKIVQDYPHLKGINFDLPDVVAAAPQYPGIEHVGGDMFKGVPSGDAIFMKAVLHNWNDKNCKRILQNCYKALPENGKLVVVEEVLDPAEKRPVDMDVLMLAAIGGKERSENEWNELLASEGFANISLSLTSSNDLQVVIEAYKCT